MTHRIEPPAPEPDGMEIIAGAILLGVVTVVAGGILGLLLFGWVVS
ncbi:hypothetical protein [Corynebacterium pygosceleis]|nr:hypothetical protein [Corynebacterium pygosceleis]MCK7676400.1 hypothetical protein [Corynebacterium pygosceleis]MCK7676415.1 hypothetical protein [Corynebacterium pygosceleis]